MNKFTCKECNREFDSYKGLQNHNSRTHKISGAQTYVNVHYNGQWPVCKCGCNEKLNYFSTFGFGEYIRGHIARVNGGFYTKEGIEKSSETRRQQYKSGQRKQWNTDKQMTDEWKTVYRAGWLKRGDTWKQSLREAKAKNLGYTNWDEWYSSLSDRKKYYYNVWRLTEQHVHLIPDYDPELRGLAGQEGSYQIDHIIPISKGYVDNIPAEEIAAASNLRFITWEENLRKGNRK